MSTAVGSASGAVLAATGHGTGSHVLTPVDRWLLRAVSILIVGLCVAVALQILGRHIFLQPFAWTEEIARLLLVWVMCLGGIVALRHGTHPRVTAVIRRLSDRHRLAVERGLRLVQLLFFLFLIVPAVRLTITSAA